MRLRDVSKARRQHDNVELTVDDEDVSRTSSNTGDVEEVDMILGKSHNRLVIAGVW